MSKKKEKKISQNEDTMKGIASIWCGNFVSKKQFDKYVQELYGDEHESYLSKFAEDFKIEWYDEDNREAHFEKKKQSIIEFIKKASFSESLMESVVNSELEDENVYNSFFIIYDFDYKPIGISKDLEFIGSFKFSKKISASKESKTTDKINKIDRELFNALEDDNLKKVKKAIEEGANPNAKDESGDMPIHMACTTSNLDIVRYLVKEHKVNVNADGYETRPLSIAAGAGSLKIVKFLVDHGADINYVDEISKTALHYAAQSKDPVNIYNYFIANGASREVTDRHGKKAEELMEKHGIKRRSSYAEEEASKKRKTSDRSI